jgi:putative transposase
VNAVVLGLWVGQGGEGAKYWLQILTEIKNRGVEDVCIVVCDGLKGLAESINTTWPQAIVQTCVLHLIRGTFRLAGRHDWDPIAKLLRPVYTAPTEPAARERFAEFAAVWGQKYPAIIRMWETAWPEFVPFLQFDAEIRRIVYSTDDIVKGGRQLFVSSGLLGSSAGLRLHKRVRGVQRAPLLRRVAA